MQTCRDTSDVIPLYLPGRLFLKPAAKLTISVQLPSSRPHGKALSTWELMDNLRSLARPETLAALKVSKAGTDVIRLEAELDSRSRLERVVSRLDDRSVQLKDYPGKLKVRAAEAKLTFPSRHAWDSFFRDAPNMDEMKPGERPDTMHITGLPVAWFSGRDSDTEGPPSESLFRKVFEKFGRVRAVDVPASDPVRRDMKAHMTGFTVDAGEPGPFFEAYVQFAEYVAFVRAMDALRGMKLVRKGSGGEIAEAADIVVDFDRSKHMTDAAVKRRGIVRERLLERQRARDEAERAERDKEAQRKQRKRDSATQAEAAREEREARRKRKQLARLMSRERGEVKAAVADEERRLVAAQRRLQAVRLVTELFRRIELKQAGGVSGARERVCRRLLTVADHDLDKQRRRVQRAYEGSIVLRAVLETAKTRRSNSVGSLSSDDESRDPARRVKPDPDPVRPPPPPPYLYPYLPPAAYPYHDMQGLQYYGGGGRGLGGSYYPPPLDYGPRGPPLRYAPPPRRPRGGRPLYRGGPRMPYFEGPNAPQEYLRYFKRLAEQENHHQHDDRTRRHSHSRSHSRDRRRRRSRSYTRSRSRSRSYTRSRSRSRRRHSRSRSRSRSRTRSRSRDRRRKSRSRSRSKSRSRSRRDSRARTPPARTSPPPAPITRRSKSWSMPRDKEGDETRKSWSKSPAKDKPPETPACAV